MLNARSKHSGRLRHIISGTSTKKGVEEYLTLLGVSETFEHSGIDFLDFLRSGKKDFEKFSVNRRRSRSLTRSVSLSDGSVVPETVEDVDV